MWWVARTVQEGAKRLKPTLSWRDVVGQGRREPRAAGPAVGGDVTPRQFAARYQRHISTMKAMLGLMVGSILLLFALGDEPSWRLLQFLTFLVYASVYARLAFTAYAARLIWLRWDERFLPSETTLRDFFDAALSSPREALPKALPQAKPGRNGAGGQKARPRNQIRRDS